MIGPVGAGFSWNAARAQAEINHRKAVEILGLYEASKPRVRALTRSHYAVQALDWLFERPIFKSSDFVNGAGIPAPTAKRIIGVLTKEGMLKPLSTGRGRRASILAFRDLLNVAEGYGVF